MRQTNQEKGSSSHSGGIDGGKPATPEGDDDEDDYTEEQLTSDINVQNSDGATSGLPSNMRPSNPETHHEDRDSLAQPARSSQFASKVSHYASDQIVESVKKSG